MKTEIAKYCALFKMDKGGVLDGWRLTDYGDCNDFALGIASICADHSTRTLIKNMLLRRTRFYLVHSPSNGLIPRHTILWQKGMGYIDSTRRDWRDDPSPHRKIIQIPALWCLLRILQGTLPKILGLIVIVAVVGWGCNELMKYILWR